MRRAIIALTVLALCMTGNPLTGLVNMDGMIVHATDENDNKSPDNKDNGKPNGLDDPSGDNTPPSPSPSPDPDPDPSPQPKPPDDNKVPGISTPRVIITGFTTKPEVVNAGDTFTLTLHLKNTSDRTAVLNMAVQLTAATEGNEKDGTFAAFLPTSGASTIYVDRIPKGATRNISIELVAKSDLLQKPYVIDVSMVFEDEQRNEYTSKVNVSIPVRQEARFDISTPEIMPPDLQVGSEANIMFDIYNTGMTTLHNVWVRFEGETISGGDVFVGKIEAGATGNVDTMIRAEMPTTDDGTIKMIISHEDEAKNVLTREESITIFVSEMNIEPIDADEFPIEEESSSITGILIASGIALVIVIAVVTIILVKKRKKKKEANDMENLLDDVEDEVTNDENP